MGRSSDPKNPPRTVALYDQHLGLILDDRYRILAPLGEGPLTVVYSAEHVTLGTRYAVAFLREEYVSDEALVKAFLQRAKGQPHVTGEIRALTVQDAGVSSSGEPYMVKEYGEGENLEEYLARVGAMTPRSALAVIVVLARFLRDIPKGHGNLKPRNIKVSDEGNLTSLMDFGHIALPSGALGKDAFLPWLEKHPALNDITSLSLLAFLLTTGRLPGRRELALPALEFQETEADAYDRLSRLFVIGRQVISPKEATMDAVLELLEARVPATEVRGDDDPPGRATLRPAWIIAGGLVVTALIVTLGFEALRGEGGGTSSSMSAPSVPAVPVQQPPSAPAVMAVQTPVVPAVPTMAPAAMVAAARSPFVLPFYLRVEPVGSSVSVRGAVHREGNRYEVTSRGETPTVTASHAGYTTKTVVISPKKEQIVVISLERATPPARPMKKPDSGNPELLDPFSGRSNP